MDEFKETMQQFRRRYEQEYDTFVSTGIKINDGLLLVNSAVVAVLISSDKARFFSLTILLFFASLTCSLPSLYFQMELSREASMNFLSSAIMAEEAMAKHSPLEQPSLPTTQGLSDKSNLVARLMKASMLFFFLGSLVAIARVNCWI